MERKLDTEKVLWELFIQRCDEETGIEYQSDEYQLLGYNSLVHDTKLDKPYLQSIVKELRNSGLVRLCMAWNENEGYFSGSGWALTDKGIAECRIIFANKFTNA